MTDQAYLYKQYNQWQQDKGNSLIQQANVKPNQKILDVGCGTGELTYVLAKKTLPHGNVFAIDPDNARITLAKDNQPSDLNNITWSNKEIEVLDEIKPGTIDIAYANYVMHWVADKEKALSVICDALKPGGLYVMNCITEYSNIIADIAMFSEEYLPVFKAYNIVKKDNWISLLHSYKFDILETKKIDDFIFDCLDDFFVFWEAASHGKFKKDMLSNHGYNNLLKKYPNEISVFGSETLNICAVKRL
ncbi:MAG TPA: class I SAM-dependent methyltransferase [Gammaproteobacteria bacterium]|nr:class I SAM-dependent methyltransferase [Gammaproteobacteria bacterium]